MRQSIQVFKAETETWQDRLNVAERRTKQREYVIKEKDIEIDELSTVLESMEASMKNLITDKDKLLDKNDFLEHKVKIDAMTVTT